MTTPRQSDKMRQQFANCDWDLGDRSLGADSLAVGCVVCPTCGDEPGGGDQEDEAEVPVVLPVHPHAGGLQCLYRGCVCVRAAGEAPPHCRGQLLQPPLRLCTHHTLHWARLRAGRAPRHRQLRGGGGETGPSPHIAPGYILS